MVFDRQIELEKSRGLAPKPPRSERKYRLRMVRESLDERGLDAVLFFGTGTENTDPVRYLAGYVHIIPRSHTFVLIPKDDDPILLVDRPWHLDDARKMSWFDDVRTFPRGSMNMAPGEIRSTLTELFEGVSIERLGLFERSMPTIYGDLLQQLLPEVERVDGRAVWNDLVTSPSEYGIEMMSEAVEIADEGLATVVSAAEAGRPEWEVCLEAFGRMASMGAEFRHPSKTLSLIGSNSEVISNLRPFEFTANRLRRGQMFWYDQITSYSGYYIDCDRTISVGEPTSAQQEIYDVVADMYEEMEAAVKPGVRGGDLWNIGYDIAERSGYGDYVNFIHFGHTIGPSIVGRTVAGDGVDYQVKSGSFVNIEPGIFVPEVGSACIENTLYVSDDGAEPLNTTDKGIHVV